MERFIATLKRTKLFAGVGEEEIPIMLDCLGATFHEFRKGEYVFRQGQYLHDVTLLVQGKLHIQRDDYWGNRSIVNIVESGEMFGEAYVAPNSGVLMNDVVAVSDSIVMFLDINRILHVCPSGCQFHSIAVQNLFFAVCEKNRKLVQKLGFMSKRTTREKLISYLSEQAKQKNSATFEIPFNRQQLADFLSVDRSAMSNELCKMRDEGLIVFQKNRFTLLDV